MSYEILGGLPSLACPLIVSPAIGKNEKPLYLLPFPGINLNLEGFTIPHLHWVGINVTKPRLRKPLIRLAALHEITHEQSLGRTPYSQALKQETGRLYYLIFRTFMEGWESIEVPLRSDLPRNKLEEQWQIVTLFKEGSKLIEEVYAVRSSLLKSQERRYIKPELGEEILSHYKKVYEKRIPGFQMAYEAFDLIAKTLGETPAKALIYYVLFTGSPSTAFWDIIWRMCILESRVPTYKFLWKLSPEKTAFLANLSFQNAFDYFRDFLYQLDPDDSRYKIMALGDYLARRGVWRPLAQDEQINFFKFFLRTPPNTFLYTEYNSTAGVFNLHFENFKEVKYSYTYLLAEAILQQLITGKGLACPLWDSSSSTCCHALHRALLEKVWKRTNPDCSCNWKRLGCLAEDSGEN
jgi:hypothetical protein